jgi:hypothetical protein
MNIEKRCENCVFYVDPEPGKRAECLNDNPHFPDALYCDQYEFYADSKEQGIDNEDL